MSCIRFVLTSRDPDYRADVCIAQLAMTTCSFALQKNREPEQERDEPENRVEQTERIEARDTQHRGTA